MADSNLARLLALSRRLHGISTVPDLLLLARSETRELVGYDHVWFMVADEEVPDVVQLVDFSGPESTIVWDVANRLHVKEDAFLQEIMTSDEPVVVVDARTDPRTDKRIVELLQNRTIVNIPIRLVDKPWGVLGMGTFGDEGCRPPTNEQLSYLVSIAGQLAVAASRIRLVEAEQRVAIERLELERRLQRIQKLESLGTLAGGVAHDFNNLLTVISAGASLVEADTQDPMILDNIRAVLHAADRGASLTRQLLAMSRAQSLDLRSIDLNTQLTQLVGLVRRLLPASIDIEMNFATELPVIQGDAAQLDQVFMNLLINARDAMPSGGHVSLETAPLVIDEEYAELQPWAKAGSYVRVTVTDTGIGMSKEILERACEPFFSTKGARAGTGLGLAVAYGIVQQHEGLLNIYSEVGHGTTFNLYFPVKSAGVVDVPRVELKPVLSQRGHERILIADDDELVRHLTERILRRAGYELTVVGNGLEACEAVKAARFDLAIVDVVMPKMPCDILLAELWAADPNLRVVLSSGYSPGLNIFALTSRTGNELLRKPFAPTHLLSAVRAALSS